MNVVLITVLGIVLTIPILRRLRERRFDPFEPIVLFVVAYGTMFVVRPAAFLIRGSTTFAGIDITSTLPRALAIGLLGGVSFLIAYELRVGATIGRRVPAPAEIPTRTGVAAALAMTTVGVAALLAFLRITDGFAGLHALLTGRSEALGHFFQGTSSYTWYGSMMVIPATALLVALSLRERRAGLGFLAALPLGLALLRTIPVGGRIFLLPLLGGLLVLVYVQRDRRPRGPVLLGAALAALLASYVLVVVRTPESRSNVGSAVTALVRHPGDLFQPVLHGADADMAPALAGALTAVPSRLGHGWGRATLGDLVTRPIPRQLWPGKPLPPGRQVVREIWPQNFGYFDPAFSPLLFFYWDFDLVGVMLGMALYGLAARALYEWFLQHRHRLKAQVVFSLGLWFVVIALRDDPVDTAVIALFVLVPMLVVRRLPSRVLGRDRPEPRDRLVRNYD